MRNLMPSWLRVPIVFFIIFGLIEYFIDSGEKPAFIEQPLILLFLLLVLLVLITIEAITGSLKNILYQSLDNEGKARFDANTQTESKLAAWVNTTYKKMLGSKAIEEEHEIILDHNYDGIKELDNDLPPWWLYGFYASILFAVIYLVKYEIFNGENQYDELNTEYVEIISALNKTCETNNETNNTHKCKHQHENTDTLKTLKLNMNIQV